MIERLACHDDLAVAVQPCSQWRPLAVRDTASTTLRNSGDSLGHDSIPSRSSVSSYVRSCLPAELPNSEATKRTHTCRKPMAGLKSSPCTQFSGSLKLPDFLCPQPELYAVGSRSAGAGSLASELVTRSGHPFCSNGLPKADRTIFWIVRRFFPLQRTGTHPSTITRRVATDRSACPG